jgi:hypothetical protein
MKMRASCSLLPQRMTVATDQVHVWHAPLDISPSEVAGLEETLALGELSRAARFRELRGCRLSHGLSIFTHSPGVLTLDLKTFTPLAGYAGALAAEGTGWQITCGQWRE